MPRFSFSRAILAGLLLAATAQAQAVPTIERVRIGLPTGAAGQEAGATRNSAWAPVAVTLRGAKEGNPQGAFRVRIETTDLEELAYQTSVPVPALAADTLRTVTGYIVPGGDGATFRILVEDTEGRIVRTMELPSRESNRDLVLPADDILFLGIGPGLVGLKRAAEKLERPDGKEPAESDRTRRQFVFADSLALLPDRWIGYDAVDVVVLGTGNVELVQQLALDSEAPRRNALLEWVRRGGQLIISAGRNRQEMQRLLEKWPLLDVRITGGETLRTMPVLSNQWSERVNLPPLAGVEVATLTVGPRAEVLVREGKLPVIVQASCGLGRVLFVAFDLDAPPFSTWDGQPAFWTRIFREVGPALPIRAPVKGADQAAPANRPAGQADTGKYDLRAELKRGLETFEEAPTISFGWVALFLLLYILLVGPLDYFILKKLFKRLELTWITFPILALLVSVAAYFTAYALKGDDLRINKIDLVEIDLHEPNQAYGTSWFTLFSPRVATYTLGLEPSTDRWTAPRADDAPRPVLTMLEVGDRTFRAGSQDLFRRPYLYADDEAGLVRVPIPVWATRSFSASWRAPLPPGAPPLGITDDLGSFRQARGGRGISGRLTNNLRVPIRDITLIHQERCYFLGTLEPGEQKRVEMVFAADAQGQGKELNTWVADRTALAPGLPLAPSGRPINANFLEQRSAYQLIKPMLFFRAQDRPNASNAGLRRLDQTWRVRHMPEFPIPDRPRYRNEVLLVARVPMLCDLAEEVTAHPGSATRLWLGELPAAGRERPPLRGVLTQETFLRVFVPVQAER
ncbi:MAG: hypothetical protein U0840_17355 [Gemmataceae bacterium]